MKALIARPLSTNQNAIGPDQNFMKSDSRNQQIHPSDVAGPEFRRDVQTDDSHIGTKSAISRDESSKLNEPHRNSTQQGHSRLQTTELCSLFVSSLGVECSVNDCQPSVFNASQRCRKIISEDRIDPMDALLLMDDQTIKPNMSYISLINVSNPIDQEPNVSRRNSYSQSTSQLLMNKPSLLFANIFKRMTHEQRAKSISQLTRLHENLSKSTTSLNHLGRTASLPNLNRTPHALPSLTSLVSECRATNKESDNRQEQRTSDGPQNDSTGSVNLNRLQHEEKSEIVLPASVNLSSKSSPVLLLSEQSNASISKTKIRTNRSANFLETNENDAEGRSSNIPTNQPGITRTPESSNVSPSLPIRSEHEFVNASKDQATHQPTCWTNATFDDTDTSVMTRTKTVSTNLTVTDDDNDEEQSKLIHEQLKRSSLGLARDSLELLRHALPIHEDSEERLMPHRATGSAPRKRKSVLKSRLDSSDDLPTLELVSYIAIDDMQGDKYLVEKQLRRHSLTVGGSTVVSCTSPRPKRDSLTLLQERLSGLMASHPGCHHLHSAESRHVEFIREPGDTVTPALHVGRGTQPKHPSHKPVSSAVATEPSQPSDGTERSKSDVSLIGGSPRFNIGFVARARHYSLDRTTRHRASPTPSLSTTSTAQNSPEEEKVCLHKRDYDQMVRLLLRPLSRRAQKHLVRSELKSHLELRISHRFTAFQNVILLMLLISFYIFILIKSQYWRENQ